MTKTEAYDKFRTEAIVQGGFVDPQQAFLAGVKWAEKFGQRELNINDPVLVRLTATGKAKLLADHTVINARMPERVRRPYSDPVEDQNGVSTWQLWHLMVSLGHHLCLGCEMPFEAKIRIKSTFGD